MLSMAGMGNFDALAHAMTTIATGGYSTRTASIAAFDLIAVEWIIIAGMIVGSLPFAHYLAMVRGGWKPLLQDPQVRWFLALLGSVVAVLIWHLSSNGMPVTVAIRQASFNTVSIMTGTGYGSANFSAWGGFASTLLLIGMFVGGMWWINNLRDQSVPTSGPGHHRTCADWSPAATTCGDPRLLQSPPSLE